MSSFLCFICHSTVNSDTVEETREKYRDIVGINLCPDTHLCYICCHMVKKLWLFKSVCLKRSLEYPVLFSEKGTLNLQTNFIENIILCHEDSCINNTIINDSREHSINSNDYMKLEDYFHENTAEKPNVKMENDNKPNCSKSDQHFENDDGHFNNSDGKFDNSVEQFGKGDDIFEKGDEQFARDDEQFDKCDEQLGNVNCDDNDLNYSNDSNIGDDNYEEERKECLNEIRNEEINEESDTTKSIKLETSKEKGFEKILLSLEEQKSELEAQRKSKKYLEAEFKCYNCAMGFLFKDTYQAHMMRHEESNGEYRCVLCALRFASGAVLRSHASLHSVRYRCTQCHQYIRARQTNTHIKYCHGVRCEATCHLCGRVFQDGSGLQQHLKRFHMTKKSNRTYSCSVCGKNYNNPAAVRTHMIKHIHRKFPCEQCPAIFSSPYTLTQHKRRHVTSDVTRHHCDACNVTYTSRKSLLAHQRQSANHQQIAYECPICNRSCPNEKALSSHISTVHSGTKQFSCEHCTARYSSRKSLVRHIRSHTAPPQTKLAVCHICGNSFKSKSKLNRHLREVCEKNKLEEELSAYYENVLQQ